MKQYSFLNESQNHFFKKLSRYTPEEQKKIIDKLFELGKENGGFLDRNELASRIYDGQLKRIGNLAKKNGRRVSVSKDNYRPSRNTVINRLVSNDELSLLNKRYFTNPKSKKVLANGKDLISIPGKKGKILGGNHQSLINRANIANYEADEYSEILRWAKKYNISPEESVLRSSQTSPDIRHQVGNVLTRENKRSKRLKLMFPDFERIHRSVPEFKASKKSLTKQPLIKDFQNILDDSKTRYRYYNQ